MKTMRYCYISKIKVDSFYDQNLDQKPASGVGFLVNDPEGRLPCLAGGLTSARVIFPAKPGLGVLLAAQSHIPQGWGGWVIFELARSVAAIQKLDSCSRERSHTLSAPLGNDGTGSPALKPTRTVPASKLQCIIGLHKMGWVKLGLLGHWGRRLQY